MSLDEALRYLAEAHTRDHYECGFLVEVGRYPWVAQREYVEAWRVVREHLRMQTEPRALEGKP